MDGHSEKNSSSIPSSVKASKRNEKDTTEPRAEEPLSARLRNISEEQDTAVIAATQMPELLDPTESDQTIDDSCVDPAQGSEKICNEAFSNTFRDTENVDSSFNVKEDNLTISDIDHDASNNSESTLGVEIDAEPTISEKSGHNLMCVESATERSIEAIPDPSVNTFSAKLKYDSFQDFLDVPMENVEPGADCGTFPGAEPDEADQPNQVNEVDTPHKLPHGTFGALSTDSGDNDGLDTFAAVERTPTVSIKWADPNPTSTSLKIEVEEEKVAVHIPFTPKKSPYTPSQFGDSFVNSTTATPLARVLPLISSPPHSAPHSSRPQSNARNSPDPVHFPEIHNTRMSFAHSTKLTPSRPSSVDPNITSRSMSMKASFSAGASFSQPDGQSSPKGPPLFNLDATLSPTAKFRSFIKSLQPGKSASEPEEGDAFGSAAGAGISAKMASGSSAKEVNARIAKIQQEQERFRMTEKLRRSMLGVTRRISHGNSSTNSSSDLTGRKVPNKVHKNGVAQNFNANSIRAGLRRHEFRETIQTGNEIVKRQILPHDPEPQDLEQQKAYENLEHSQNGQKQELQAEEQQAKETKSEPHRMHPYKPAPVTRTGEGYMSEADWKITVKGRSRSPKKSTKGGSAPLTAREGLAIQRANALNANSSSLDLVQFVESTLKEQAVQVVDSADCPGEPDVPLCYLQSAHLIDRRFGWEAKDHSIVKHDLPKQKSWVTLRGIVQSTGAFHLIAAAAAPPLTGDSPADRLKRMEPLPNAPVIVQEATPVTEFVANVLRTHPPRAASPDSVERHAKTPIFSIAKQIPRRIDPDQKDSPPAPSLKALTKEEAKSVKIKAITKEFHDRYNGLIFHDSYRDLTWRGTEDMILGTVRPKKNDILLTRSDMRWAGKTLNLFRPWSAAREVDVIDQFRLQRDKTSSNLLASKPGSPKVSSPPGSPDNEWYKGMDHISVNGESSIGSLGSYDTHGGRGSATGERPAGSHGMRHNNSHHGVQTHPPKHATHPVPGGSVGHSRTGLSHASHNSQTTSKSSPKSSRQGVRSPPKINVSSSSASVGSLNTHHSAHSMARGGVISNNNHTNHNNHGHTTGTGIPSMVTFAANTLPFDQSDNASAYTLSSNAHQSKASHSKRPPLLINLVKPVAAVRS